jgi:hypothetical protein
MTIKELAEKHGKIEKEFHEGSVKALINNFQCYLERTSFGYILQVNLDQGVTTRYDTIEELEQALLELTKGPTWEEK